MDLKHYTTAEITNDNQQLLSLSLFFQLPSSSPSCPLNQIERRKSLRNSAKSLPTLFHNFRTMNTKISCNYVEIQSDRDDKILSKRREHGKQTQNVFSSEQQTLSPVPLPNLTLTDKIVPRVLPSLKTHTAPYSA
jgi:hypothetical protein